MRRLRRLMTIALLKSWTVKTLCLSCTLLAQQANPRVWYTVAEDIWSIQPIRFKMFFSINPTTCIGVLLTSVGSQATPTLSMDHWPMVQRQSCLKGFLPILILIGFGRFVPSIRSLIFILRQQPYELCKNTPQHSLTSMTYRH